MKVTLLLSAVGVVGITMLSVGVASHSREVRGQAKELVALVNPRLLAMSPYIEAGPVMTCGRIFRGSALANERTPWLALA